MNEILEKLSAPFDFKDLKFYPVAIKDGRGKVGSYIDARDVMNRLDAVLGVAGWSTSYRCIDPADKAVECTLSIFQEGAWVSRADVGYPNEAKDADNPDKEPWKAAYSDSLKRAAVQWGVGRYIYSLELERDWLPVDQYRKFTEQPQLRGAPREPEAQPRNAAATRAPSEAPVTPPKRTFWDVTREMGYSDDEVIATSQRMFENKEPKALGTEQKKRLMVALEDGKRKGAA